MSTVLAEQLNLASYDQFLYLFRSLPSPALVLLRGLYRVEFVGPAWLRAGARPSLFLIGLGGWWGKEFWGEGHGVNIVVRRGSVQRVLPMQLVHAPSLIDGQVGVSLQYDRESPFPWPFVTDELRRLNPETLLGIKVFRFSPLARLPLPFLLRAADKIDRV
jgi:hypothetical protein